MILKELLKERDEGFDVRQVMNSEQMFDVLTDLGDNLHQAAKLYANEQPEAGHKNILHVMETLEALIVSAEI